MTFLAAARKRRLVTFGVLAIIGLSLVAAAIIDQQYSVPDVGNLSNTSYQTGGSTFSAPNLSSLSATTASDQVDQLPSENSSSTSDLPAAAAETTPSATLTTTANVNTVPDAVSPSTCQMCYVNASDSGCNSSCNPQPVSNDPVTQPVIEPVTPVIPSCTQCVSSHYPEVEHACPMMNCAEL